MRSVDHFAIPPSATLLAFDFGTGTTGVALGVQGHARPYAQLSMHKGKPNKETLQKIIDEWQPSGFIVGIPMLDGDDTTVPVRARIIAFTHWLEKTYHRPAELIDESYSSCVIKRRPGERVDDRSAAIILEQWYSNARESS